jgi:hypothetical protein
MVIKIDGVNLPTANNVLASIDVDIMSQWAQWNFALKRKKASKTYSQS